MTDTMRRRDDTRWSDTHTVELVKNLFYNFVLFVVIPAVLIYSDDTHRVEYGELKICFKTLFQVSCFTEQVHCFTEKQGR